MTSNPISWSDELELLKQKRRNVGALTGVASPDQIADKTGLEIMQAMLEGTLPKPHISDTMDFDGVEVGDGFIVFQGTPQLKFFNPLGTVHGGWYATLLDSALGCAVHTKLPVGKTYTTTELSMNIVRAASLKTGPMRAIGHVIHCGKQLATAEAKIIDEAGKLYAHGTTTCFIFDIPNGRP
jgi:uncharacterized protein (TIGR00369 family)